MKITEHESVHAAAEFLWSQGFVRMEYDLDGRSAWARRVGLRLGEFAIIAHSRGLEVDRTVTLRDTVESNLTEASRRLRQEARSARGQPPVLSAVQVGALFRLGEAGEQGHAYGEGTGIHHPTAERLVTLGLARHLEPPLTGRGRIALTEAGRAFLETTKR